MTIENTTKKYIVKNVEYQQSKVFRDGERRLSEQNLFGYEDMQVSDGYHTMDELYEHRIRLFIEVCKMRAMNLFEDVVWCSTQHADGSTFGDWFILGIHKEKGKQITYHLPSRFWNEVCEFAEVLKNAPEWDGHTSADVLERLKKLWP